MRFERLLQPGYIGPVKTRNRIIKTGAGMLMWHEEDLHMREEVKAFYEGLARGGVGLLVVESPTIDYPLGARWRKRYRIDDDKYIQGLSELVEVIHKHGCPAFMQMNHDGPWQSHLPFEPNPLFSGPPIASSPVSMRSENDFHNEVPRELTLSEIEEIIDKFANAAVRAKKAGFDGVDINAASSHLLHNFFSPFWNRRQDEYGGSLENRARIVIKIIGEIKNRLGKDFPVSIIMNGIEVGQAVGIEDSQCLTPEESQAIAKLLQKAGADAIQIRSHWLGYHVGAYLPDSLFYPDPPIPLSSFPKRYYTKLKGAGANILFAEWVKKLLTIPVTVVGRLDPELGEKVLKEGKADFIGMTRRLIADPELPNKLAEGRLKEIAPCTGCDNCLGSGRCRINGLLGTPYHTIQGAEKKKKVFIIGGGPAGMEAARVSAIRGHEVMLYEKSHQLGGLLPLAALVKGSHPEDLCSLINYLEDQMKRLGVKIHLNQEVNLALVERLKPDVIFLAIGGIPDLPNIPGINGPNVIIGAKLYQRVNSLLRFFSPGILRWLTKFYMPIGKKVIIIGGGIQGCELAEFLTKRGRKVTIVEKAEFIGEGMVDALLWQLHLWFKKKGVSLITGVKEYVEITHKGLLLINKEGRRQVIEADTIIPALPLKPNMDLFENLKGKAPEVYAIGDCKEPHLIVDAIGTGLRTALKV